LSTLSQWHGGLQANLRELGQPSKHNTTLHMMKYVILWCNNFVTVAPKKHALYHV